MAARKLSDEQQAIIRIRRKAGEGLQVLADEFGVANSRIHAICMSGISVGPKRRAGRPPKNVKVIHGDDFMCTEDFDAFDLRELRFDLP